jgi:hypothetical protein
MITSNERIAMIINKETIITIIEADGYGATEDYF